MNELDIMQDFLFYNSDDGSVKVQVLVDSESETIWATQKAMAELFGVTVPNISYHLKNIFHSGELSNETVIKEILITAQNGARGLFAETFTPVFRTNLNMPSLAKLPLKSSHLVRMPNTLRWDC